MPSFLLPLIGAGVQLGSQALAYGMTKQKRPKPQSGMTLRALQDVGLQTSNQAASNAGLMLGPTAAARGMSNSNIVPASVASVAAAGNQQAVQGVQAGYFDALMADRNAKDAYEAEKRSRLHALITSSGEAAGSAISGVGAMQEENLQQQRTEQLLRSIYGNEYDSIFNGGSRRAM